MLQPQFGCNANFKCPTKLLKMKRNRRLLVPGLGIPIGSGNIMFTVHPERLYLQALQYKFGLGSNHEDAHENYCDRTPENFYKYQDGLNIAIQRKLK
jgi:hypothetical protein